jgi:hypothetical protein
MDLVTVSLPNFQRTVAGFAAMLTFSFLLAAESDTREPGRLLRILNQLNAPQFEDRLAAERQFDQLSAGQIRELIELAPAVESAEAATRILHGLDRLYVCQDEEKSIAASDVLESFLDSPRGILAEEASWLLRQHWKRRQEFAVAALRKHGAQVVLPDAITRARLQNPRAAFGMPDVRQIQVFLASEWDGSDAGRRALNRLPGLARQLVVGGGRRNRMGRRGFLAQRGQSPPLVTIFLVAGHPLSQEEAGLLKGAFGASVQDRGETMLGITAIAGVAAGGCLVKDVVEHGSGAAAGLKAGDLITHVQGVQVSSFDDLVEELRQYSAGDTVSIGYIDQTRGGQPAGTREVILRSWTDYARAINAAAPADGAAPVRDVE